MRADAGSSGAPEPGWMFVQLFYNGQPLQSSASPDITCRDDTRMTWINCGILPAAGANAFVMPRPAPGKYVLHVEVDENKDNPARYPGDYDIFHEFTVTPDSPTVLIVDMNRLIHLTAPWDNAKPMEGMLTHPWDKKPAYETPRYALRHRLPMIFTWEPLVPGAEYDYCVITSNAQGRGPDVVRSKTSDTTVTLSLPPTPEGFFYEFSVAAHANGHSIGDFFSHDAGVQGWTCQFRVIDKTLPLWIYPGALIVLFGLVWLLRQIPSASTSWLIGAVGIFVLVAIAWQAGRRSESHQAQEQVQQAQSQLTAERARRNQAFLSEWQAAVPKPAWWDTLPPTPLKIATLGDLMSVWQTGDKSGDKGRLFYKLAYQAILDHPEDEQLVPMAIHLMTYVDSGNPNHLAMLKFGVDRFFYYNQRTDNCAHCKVGDTVGEMVRDLAGRYISGGDDNAAIDVIDRLVKERAPDVSDYNLALTFGVKSQAHWALRNKEAALQDIQDGLQRFPSGWQADQLRKTLDRYQKEDVPPVLQTFPATHTP